jgi:hypothetical protein
MVVTAGNRIELRTLDLGLESPERVEVRNGLREGDMVVIAGRGGLEANDVVKPKVTAMTAAKE